MSVDRSRLSACVLMAPQWSLAECVAGWQRAGLAGIGVTRPSVTAVGEREAAAILRDSGLRIANWQNLDPFDVVHPERFDELLPETLHQLDLAAEVSADCLYACVGRRGSLQWDAAADRLVEQILRLVPELHDRGVRLAIEPIHPLRQDLSFVNLGSDAVSVVERVDDPAVGYVLDFWHLWWERGASELARDSARHVLSCQPSDHKAVTMRTLDRALPGAGIIPIGELVQALEDGGYRGMYDLEVLSDDNELRGYDETLRASIEGFEASVG
jgi:sugar phosphate isomerase/epimerase